MGKGEPTAFDELTESFQDDELPLVNYFESTWIGSPVGRRGRRTPPIFLHDMWNVLGRHCTGSTRTTNALESFHYSFNSLLTCQHPSIWVLLKSLQRQQALTDNILVHIDRGDTKQPSAKERSRNERIVNLVTKYNPADANKTLRGITYNYMI